MLIHEFGQQNEKNLLFFPGSCEPWQEFAYAARELAARFHVLLVTPDGHDPEEGTDFLSVEKTVDDTVCWLKEHGIERLDALYGLSFGGGMAVRFLTTQLVSEMGYAEGTHRQVLFAVGLVLYIFIMLVNFALQKMRKEAAGHE